LWKCKGEHLIHQLTAFAAFSPAAHIDSDAAWVQVEAKRKEIAEAEKAAAATQSRLSELRINEKECAALQQHCR